MKEFRNTLVSGFSVSTGTNRFARDLEVSERAHSTRAVRFQHGEVVLSNHFRKAGNRDMPRLTDYNSGIPEDPPGSDARWDLKTWFWTEGSGTRKRMDPGTLTNQEVLNAGIDYTFGIGNGPYLAYEHLIGAGLRTLLNVTVLSFSFVIIIFMKGVLIGRDRRANADMANRETGSGQYRHNNYDPYDSFSLNESRAPVPSELKAVIVPGNMEPLLREQFIPGDAFNRL